MKTGHLPLPTRNDYNVEWLSTAGNAGAFEAMQRWCGGEDPRCLVFVGACSKTFLATIASKSLHVSLCDGVLPTFDGSKVFVIDNADRIADSEAFFHWYNRCVSEGLAVLYTASRPPNEWSHALPDLMSRLRTLPIVYIAPWTDDELEMLLPRMMRAQGLDMTEATAHYALTHMERSFEALRCLVDYAHQYAPQRRVTKTLLKEFFQAAT